MKNLFLIPLMMVVLAFTSCGGASLNAIDEKIQEDGIEAKFSSREYDAMIRFLENLFENNPKYDPSDDKQMDQAGKDFGRMFSYMMVLGLAKDNGDLSSSQVVKLDEIQVKAQAANSVNSGYQEEIALDDFERNDGYNDSEYSEGSQKMIVDLNGNIIGNYVGETSTTYKGCAQDEFEVSKSNHKVIELNNENGEGVVYCKEPGDVIKVYAHPSLNAPVIGNMIYEEGSLPQTYECMGKELNWYKIRFNHKTGYVLDDSVEWAAEDYF